MKRTFEFKSSRVKDAKITIELTEASKRKHIFSVTGNAVLSLSNGCTDTDFKLNGKILNDLFGYISDPIFDEIRALSKLHDCGEAKEIPIHDLDRIRCLIENGKVWDRFDTFKSKKRDDIDR